MTLDKLEVGASARITALGGQGELRNHLLSMGLTPGTLLTVRKRAPLGDPIQIEVRGYELTLREQDAGYISVSASAPAAPEPRATTISGMAHPGIGESADERHSHGRFSARAIPEGAPVTLALIGNQNCGKTTLFNQLTGSKQHVGNFPGVTVDRKDGVVKSHPEVTLVDLPGVYSLSPYTNEEIVTRDFLLRDCPDGVINIVDASNIERNMNLTLQLMETDVPMVLALNMMDEVRANGGTIDVNQLESTLGIPVVPISASNCEGLAELVDHVLHVAYFGETPGRVDFCPEGPEDDPAEGAVHRCIHACEKMTEDHAKRCRLPVRFAATKLVEGDSLVRKQLDLTEADTEAVEYAVAQMEDEVGLDREAAIADMRFSFIESLCDATVVRPVESRERSRSVAVDRILTGRWTAIPCFFALMALIFFLTFNVIGAALSDALTFGIDSFAAAVQGALEAVGYNETATSLIVDGVIGGVGSVIGFLPTIVTLFLFLSLMEDSGYMARVAFVMDKALRRIGLSGRSFVPMLIGFGCSVPAIMAARTLPSERDRRMTILLTPFMSCSAKLPIYGLITTAFFPPSQRMLVMVGLYLFGIVCGVLYAVLLKTARFDGEPVPFVMELPNYRMPSARSVCQLIWEKARGFLRKAFTIVFAASLIIWFLQTFDPTMNVAASPDSSLLALLGGLVAPVFAPLGFGDWRVSTALVTGLAAKETVVSTMTVLMGGSATMLSSLFTPFSAVVFLVFTLLYSPCVAAIATARKELGSTRWAVYMFASQCGIAWVVAFAVRCVGTAFGLV